MRGHLGTSISVPILLIALSACSGSEVAQPTPNIDQTIDVAVRATVGAIPTATIDPMPTLVATATVDSTPDVPAMVAAAVQATLTAMSTTSPIPTPSFATPTPTPTPTPETTATPTTPDRPTVNPAPVLYTYRVVETYPHDREAFTQGLVFADGMLYESTGLRGRSSLRLVELETGEVRQSRELADQFFGEGITVFGDRIVQLTWQSQVGFVYAKDSFELVQEFSYSTEGWGLTHDGQRLIMSDGTPTLHFLDPETFQETGAVEVYDQEGPVNRLNEMEYIQGEVYANVWQTDRIALIDPDSGWVRAWVDLSGLLSEEDRHQGADVLNGIAYDSQQGRLFVTGKLWPKIFEIKLVSEK